MSLKHPYIFDQNSPVRLKNLIVKFPQTLKVFENIKNSRPLGQNAFFHDRETAEVMIEFITNELQGFELIEKSETSENGFEPLFSQIMMNKESFTNIDKTKFLVRRLNETANAFDESRGDSIPVFGSLSESSLSPSDYRAMVEEVYEVFDKYRSMPEGDTKFKMTFACKEI